MPEEVQVVNGKLYGVPVETIQQIINYFTARGLKPDNNEFLRYLSLDFPKIVKPEIVGGNEALEAYRNKVRNDIDFACERFIKDGPGFEFPENSGKFFSLTSNAQAKWAGLAAAVLIDQVFQVQFVPYPLIIMTKDDFNSMSIDGPQTALTVYAAAMSTVTRYLANATIAKQYILTSTSVEEIKDHASKYLGSDGWNYAP